MPGVLSNISKPCMAEVLCQKMSRSDLGKTMIGPGVAISNHGNGPKVRLLLQNSDS
jgi:hypothetical protein